MLLWLTGELGRDPALRMSAVGGARLSEPRAVHDVALLLRQVAAATDPLALLTIVRNTLKPAGVCLLVERHEDLERLGDIDKLARAAGFVRSERVGHGVAELAQGAETFVAFRLER